MTTDAITLPAVTADRNRGLALPCPCCGESEASISLDLFDDPFASDTLHCQECEADFSAQQVRDLVRRWAPVLAWLDAMPGTRQP